MADPDLGPYVVRLIHDELLPLLPTPPGMDLAAYADRTVERLSNPRMGDDLGRLARRGSTKVVDYLLPSVTEAVERGARRDLLVLAVAGWLRYLGCTADDGTPIEVQDARLDELRGLLAEGDPSALLGLEDVFGDLGSDPGFVDEVRRDLGRLSRDGVRGTIRAMTDAHEAGAGDAGAGGPSAGAANGSGTVVFRPADLRAVRTLLCDADGNLFGSEEPAFVASAEVTNRFLREHGVRREYGAEELRLATTGMNFRATAVALALEHGVAVEPDLVGEGRAAEDLPGGPGRDGRAAAGAVAGAGADRPVLTTQDLERWVVEERRAVAAHLRRVLRPDPAVGDPLRRMGRDLTLAAVSSSATPRLVACFAATALDGFFVPARTFSAEDSLPRPTSKPDPAIYLHACERLGVAPGDAVAVEDSVPGARSAVAAGCITLGNVRFVAEDERPERIAALRDAGVVAVVDGWDGVEAAFRAGRLSP